MISINDYNFFNKRALVRVDFNVPLNEKHEIADDTRIVTAIPTLQKILVDGGSIIIMTHLGRPKGKYTPEMSLIHIIDRFAELLGRNVKFADDCIGEEAMKISGNLKNGEVLLLENVRFYNEEMDGDDKFAEKLASLGDVYVNDAFGTAHRAHASTCAVTKYFKNNKMFGFLIESEIRHIDKALNEAKSPLTAIIGGSKISTKIHIIRALLEKVDHLIIGGGIAFTFVKAMGGDIGNSLFEEDMLEVAKEIIEKSKKSGVKLHLPFDCIVADKFNNDADIAHCEIDKIKDGWMGLDIGIKSAEKFTSVIEESATIIWNGPMGAFEMPHFTMGTLKIAMAVALSTDKGAYSLIGGGDSIAAVNKFSLAHKISYISTAGGALLEYIEGKELPALSAIRSIS